MQYPKEYDELAKKLAPYNLVMGNAADTILNQDVSSYPIFIILTESIPLGIAIVEQTEEEPLYIHASTLEELATKKVIEMGKVDHFREVYKDPAEFLCLFVVDEQEAKFVFIPRISVDN
ncbi:hypothetical protein [Flavilitoribacter nigricans]|uniref:Uncharacterized protein n=1 Tax=Flavilitoribacter nigricans (strain ATCC 23147 / DSM 23189 / NBRC 102662 / NCIMB 1420 / SS-2) TaxID=1122177 RepID=A0A2D0N3X6_FLAN2|nr:hypothetical protein [Flavilitoribacter nigricans]PHN03088.1 hypothetical protein CRP01_28835 [Flavilitoribacter nigricans DSM 23189 = NBRC 102662]